jgi:ACS family tartrate transporter-like MFS transporter
VPPGWRDGSGCFLVEGLPAVLLGFVTFVYLPDSPETATWLKPEERAWIQARIEKERVELAAGSRTTLKESVSSGRVWACAAIYFALVMSVYGVTFWLPQIIKTFSAMSDFTVGMISVIPWLAAAIGMVLISKHSDRSGERRRHVTASALAGAAGLVAAG